MKRKEYPQLTLLNLNLKADRGLTFTFTLHLSYIVSSLFTRVKSTVEIRLYSSALPENTRKGWL